MTEAKRPLILFASPHSLIDHSSGAALSIRTLLSALTKRTYEATALQATIFDTPAGGTDLLKALEQRSHTPILRFLDQGVEHFIVRTKETGRGQMTALEQEQFLDLFRQLLEERRPSLLLLWGGLLLERTLMSEARKAGVPVAFVLVNPTYDRPEVFENVDVLLTDSQATADLYKQRFGLTVHPAGKFIDLSSFKAPVRTPRYVTFINPAFEKGVNVFATLARRARSELPEAEFLVVESRGRWQTALEGLGLHAGEFPNVRVVPPQKDMRTVYGSTRVLLVPSTWHESGPRVIPEAVINGIPVLASTTGGQAEMLAGSGFLFDLPASVRASPRIPAPDDVVTPWLKALERLLRDDTVYRAECEKAVEAASSHDLDRSVLRFLDTVSPLINANTNRIVSASNR
jgi:glycosyltransferase involved in cell wall biosynthesis